VLFDPCFYEKKMIGLYICIR